MTVASILQCSSVSHVVKKNVLSLQGRIMKTFYTYLHMVFRIHQLPIQLIPALSGKFYRKISRTFHEAWDPARGSSGDRAMIIRTQLDG